MKTSSNSSNNLHFISGGGEAGELIRAFNWSQTKLGPPEKWPQSLRTTLALLLHSAFPMFLFWGKDLTCFYNDAYRPSLGKDGKHPAIGKNGKDVFPEIWDFIGPIITKVMKNAEPVWYEDQLLPIYRNGQMEDVYWTFSYSAAFDDKGKVSGVLVTCMETTDNVETLLSLLRSEEKFRIMAEGTDILITVTDEDNKPSYINKAWSDLTGKSNTFLMNSDWSEMIHEADRDELMARYNEAIEKKENWGGEFRIMGPAGKFKWLYVRASVLYKPDGSFAGYISSGMDITDRKENERSVKDAASRVRNIIDSVPFPIGIYTGREMRIEFANESIQEVWGKGNDVIGKLYSEILPELGNQSIFAELEGVYTTGIPFHARNQQIDIIVDGKLQPYFFNYSFTPLYDTDGNVYAVMNTAAEITDINLARKLLEEAEAKARLAIHSAELGLYEVVYKTDEMITDKRFNEIWGLDRNVTRDEYSKTIHPHDLFIRDIAHKESLETGQLEYTVRLVWKDGAVRWVRVTGKVLFDDKGTPLKIIGVAQDVTAAKNAQQKIEQSEKNIRNMVLQAPVAMCILTGPLHVVEIANEQMIELWGKPAADVMNKPIFEGLPDARDQGLEKLMADVYQSGETFNAYEMPVVLFRKGKNETVYQNFVYQPYRDSSGATLGILAITIDVTQQVLARQKIEEVVIERTKELADANSNLQKSNAELAQFAYIASHDLQEPLRKISTFTQMLENRVAATLDEKSITYLQKIQSSSSRMNALIRDVLSYSELVKDTEIFARVDLNQVIQSVITDFELLIEQKEAKIEFKNMPVIEAIPLQMAQLFGNLVSNSLKFSRKDVLPVIKITSRRMSPDEIESFVPDAGTDYIKIRVEDNGIGFKKEYAEQIFNIFQRLHGKADYEGTGIGLAMCKKIALNHHGDLDASESSENGAVFTIILPVNRIAALAGA